VAGDPSDGTVSGRPRIGPAICALHGDALAALSAQRHLHQDASQARTGTGPHHGVPAQPGDRRAQSRQPVNLAAASATTLATRPTSPPSGSPSMKSDITTERRSPAAPTRPRAGRVAGTIEGRRPAGAVSSSSWPARPPRRPHPWALDYRNGLHYIRDITFGEDACKIRTGSSPSVMACLHCLIIGVLC
jgi:hypothetical protein